MTGQWQKHNTLDNDALETFKAAYPNTIGVTYKAIAPYYTQVVAGTNYIFTVEATVTSPVAQPIIKYFQTFKALPNEGAQVATARILDQLPLHVDYSLDFFLDQRFPTGGWTTQTQLNENALKVFNAAKPQLLGCEYIAVAPYFTQVVNGTNYVFTALIKTVDVDTTIQNVVFIKTHQSTDEKIEPAIIIGTQAIQENVA